MIYPTTAELAKGEYNRYEVALAAAKCARIVTDEYVKQREAAERSITGNKETDKPINTMIDKELRDEKAVKTAIKRINAGDYEIVRRPEGYVAEVEEETVEEPVDRRTLAEIFKDDSEDDASEDIEE